MLNVSKRFDQFITQLKMQEYDMMRFGMEPNRIVLGVNVYHFLESEFRYGRYAVIEYHNDDVVAYMLGFPITIDHQNKWLIQVCSGCQMDGKELLYPGKIDTEELKEEF